MGKTLFHSRSYGYESVLARITQLAHPKTAIHILNVGTGTGNVAASSAKHGCHVVGIDFSAEMLEQAQAKMPGRNSYR